ncbi:hypothetical protein G6F50_015476 [Rhizopus delemar]|uniref:Uncharacterized protein n=1 Tax=Rhizopus delemar TaxID=936053 RepID=A0A9P6XXX2_9FUNG|nr:hypothetical protein G6F50_015476 [Rhizopus delemar]
MAAGPPGDPRQSQATPVPGARSGGAYSPPQAGPAVMLEAAGIAAHALLVQIPRRTPAVRQLMLLAAAAITATQHAEGAAQILGRELAAHVQPQFAIAETGDVGHACGQRQVARQWKADTCLQHALAVTAGAAALVALPALHEPLQARIGPVTALVERCPSGNCGYPAD